MRFFDTSAWFDNNFDEKASGTNENDDDNKKVIEVKKNERKRINSSKNNTFKKKFKLLERKVTAIPIGYDDDDSSDNDDVCNKKHETIQIGDDDNDDCSDDSCDDSSDDDSNNDSGHDEDNANSNNDKKIHDSTSSIKEILKDRYDTIKNKFESGEIIIDEASLGNILNRVKIHVIDVVSCTHEVAIPIDEQYIPLETMKTKPAKEYKFTLDPFQNEAICCIENSQSVLVSAHTSAGKTVVAEYAIAVALRDKQRVIYTTPIKALSNQKFREFSEEFKDVGIMTGDITINPTASVLVMTTEILRNMLYRGSEVTREVGWIIYDEIHYMRDKERGVIWEESLILTSSNTRFVFLSATIPNARQFAEWIVSLHNRPCHVVYTDYRPTPLTHYMYTAIGDQLHMVVDDKGVFLDRNFNQAITSQQEPNIVTGDEKLHVSSAAINKRRFTSVFNAVKMIMELDYAPAIIFSFSKKDCEHYAKQMAQLDFNTPDEKKLIEEIYTNAIASLSEEDKKLPSVEFFLPFLKRGIGIHHGGLLPILKETVELLFGEGLIKTLFATETFAMGLNMPARTVLFTNTRKFDGKDFRYVTSGEYIQMSGRAGRRGLDKTGVVILMIDDQFNPTVGREIIQGKPNPINSAFRLHYNMILNLLRVEEINPEYIIRKSFLQYQQNTEISKLYQKMKVHEETFNALKIDRLEELKSYFALHNQIEKWSAEQRRFISKPQYVLPFMKKGRVIKLIIDNEESDWAIIYSCEKATKNSTSFKFEAAVFFQRVGSILKPGTVDSNSIFTGETVLMTFENSSISEISNVCLSINEKPRTKEELQSISKKLHIFKQCHARGVPLLDPVKDMKIRDQNFVNIVKKINDYKNKVSNHQLTKDPELNSLCKTFADWQEMGIKLTHSKLELKHALSTSMIDDLIGMKKVLRRLGYCEEGDVITQKGRVACELSGADELLLTEMIFNGIFQPLAPEQITALLSCFVCDEKLKEIPKINDELQTPMRQMHELARRIAKVSAEANLKLDEEVYINSFKPFMIDIVYAWSKGSSFAEIMKMGDFYEGSIIRCIRRLEEVLRELAQAAKNIGNIELLDKFNKANTLIKRDVIFAASLYL